MEMDSEGEMSVTDEESSEGKLLIFTLGKSSEIFKCILIDKSSNIVKGRKLIYFWGSYFKSQKKAKEKK